MQAQETSDISATRYFRNADAAISELNSAKAVIVLLTSSGDSGSFGLRHDLVCNAIGNIYSCIERAESSMKGINHA